MATAKKAPAAAKPAAKAAPKPAAKTTAVAVKKSSGGALAEMQAKMAADLAALQGRTGAPGGDKISCKNKVFKLPDGTESSELQLVIVDFTSVNNFYEGAYNKDAIVPPACFAIGNIIADMVPSEKSPVKQSDACAGCPMNEFGSDGNGKACKNARRLAVLPPDADEDTPLWILDTSPTANKAFDAYVRSVAQKFNMTPVGVVTTVSFAEELDYPSLRFSDPTPNENIAMHYARMDEARDRLAQEPDVSGYTAPPPPKGRGAKAAPARR